MAPPELPPPKKKSPQPAPIFALGDDLLREVFLRLPSLPSLVRAALACPDFHRAVCSSPAFRRRFRDLHSPSLLGVFLVNDEPDTPTFAPVLLRRRHRRSDPDHAAALRGLDVFLTLLPDAAGDEKDDAEDEEKEDDGVAEDEDEEKDAQDEDEEHDEDKEEEDEDEEDTEEEEDPIPMLFSSKKVMEDVEEEEDDDPGWSMSACSDGYVLLVTPRWNTKKVAVYNPITRALHLFPGPPDELFTGASEYTEAEFHVISSQGDDRSFRVLCVCKENGGARVAVVSPENREWQISPTAGRLRDEGNGTLVNGFVYWASTEGDLYQKKSTQGDNVLNTATLQFSQIDLPADMTGFSYSPEMSKVGETNDGKLCLARGSDLQLDVWIRKAGKDGVDKWMRDKEFRMVDSIDKLALNFRDECPLLSVNIVAIISGIVYFSIHQKDPPNWLLSFCLETRELKKLCPVTSYEFCYPYIMAWPPSLVRNKAGEV